MDICRWNIFSSAESISFQWIIIVMLYLATIILSLSAESMDERMYINKQNLTVWEHEMVNTLNIYCHVVAIIINKLNFSHFITGKQTGCKYMEFAIASPKCGRNNRLDHDWINRR